MVCRSRKIGKFLSLAEEWLVYRNFGTKKVSAINGVKWDDGKRVVEPVFNAPGEYLFYMADNLETEPENTFHLMHTVTYRK